MSKGNFCGISKDDETTKYLEVKEIANNKVKQMKANVDSLANELHELQEVYDLDEKEGLAQWFVKDNRFKEVRQDLLRAERACKKPYFGRIDFVDSDNDSKATFYIGKSVIYEDPANPVVIDWRAPISSVYYESNLGKCRYKVPREGSFEIDLQRKRTYEIDNEGVRDFYDSEVVANDELLTKYLSKSKRNVLSEIIATIQKEQNEVIRINPHHNVLIQGSAGSGKTTVAMHRISYILYNYEREFDPRDFYIVGSNKLLLNYITGVLPDLDIYDIPQMTMEELFVKLLYEEWNDDIKIRKLDKTDINVGIKGQTKWFDDLEEFCEQLMWEYVPKQDIRLKENNHILLSGDDIEKILTDMKGRTIKDIYDRLKDILISKLETEMFGKGLSYSQEMQKRMYSFYENYFARRTVKDSVFEIYKRFVKTEFNKGTKCEVYEDEFDLYDLASLAFIYKRLKETEVVREACHVVIDEAQDFGISVYRSLKYCLSKCTFTIMGDVAQNINLGCGLGDWEELKAVMLPDEYDYFGLLRKSYRNTVEISEFATDILRHGSFPIYPVEPIVRHGNEVNIIQKNSNDIYETIACDLKKWKDEYETIAVICKDMDEAVDATKQLKDVLEVQYGIKNYVNIFSEENVDLSGKVTVLPIEYSKGLEFDAVIILDASKNAYPKEDGYAKLLYVAATRALHELKVYYKGELTGLIADPIPEDRVNVQFEDDNFHKKALEMPEDERTTDEIARDQALIGDSERVLRDKYGPKKIEVVKPKDPIVKKPIGKLGTNSTLTKTPVTVAKTPISATKTSKRVTINEHRSSIAYSESKTNGSSILRSSVYGVGGVKIKTNADKKTVVTGMGSASRKRIASEFGDSPVGISLTPPGHGVINHAVKWINEEKDKVTITSFYDNLCITPVTDDTVRITIYKTEDKHLPVPKEINVSPGVKWNCVQGRNSIDITTDKVVISVDRKTGVMSLGSKKLGPLLTESAKLSRQFYENDKTWYHFWAWKKNENIKAIDEDDESTDVISTAKYISHGPESDEASIFVSMNGYRVVIPSANKIMLNTIPAYSYIKYEKAGEIDFYFQVVK